MENHELIECARDLGRPTWTVRCSCGWYKYEVPDPFIACKAFGAHIPIAEYTWEDMEDEYEHGRAVGKEEGDEEGFDRGWKEGRKELVATLQGLKEILDGI